MATRLYLVATTAPSATPTPDAGWPDTTQMVRRTLATTQDAATETLSGTLTGTAGNYTLVVQLVSPPLSGAQTISGTWTAISRGRELTGTDNINSRARAARVYDSGGTLRGTLVAYSNAASTTELGTTAFGPTSGSGQQHALTSAITTVNAQDGDYIVVELGYGETSTGTTPQWQMMLGGSGTDHGTANNDATGTVPWVEFSATLTFQSGGVTGTLNATLPALTSTSAGSVTVTGTAAATLPSLAAATAGAVEVSGSVAAALPALTVSLAGSVVSDSVSGSIDVTLPALTAQLTGVVEASGSLSATLPALTASAAGAATVSGAFAGSLPSLAASFAASVIGAAVPGTMRHATRTAVSAGSVSRPAPTTAPADRTAATAAAANRTAATMTGR